jgi:hypothetical protein
MAFFDPEHLGLREGPGQARAEPGDSSERASGDGPSGWQEKRRVVTDA